MPPGFLAVEQDWLLHVPLAAVPTRCLIPLAVLFFTACPQTFCAATTGLFKIEFHLDWSQRLLIKSVQLRFGSGLPTVFKNREWQARNTYILSCLPVVHPWPRVYKYPISRRV